MRLSEEEKAPCGKLGLQAMFENTYFPFKKWDTGDELDDCLVSRPKPFRLTIWEPLRTKAPGPHLAQPLCCYVRTVIFYCTPYRVRAFSKPFAMNGRWSHSSPGGFEEWDRIETRTQHNDVVRFENDLFEIGGGTVRWAVRRWWMCRSARRLPL